MPPLIGGTRYDVSGAAARLEAERSRLEAQVARRNAETRAGPGSMGVDRWNSFVIGTTAEGFKLDADIRAFNDAVRAYNNGSVGSGSGGVHYTYDPSPAPSDQPNPYTEHAKRLAELEQQRKATLQNLVDEGRDLDTQIAAALADNWPRWSASPTLGQTEKGAGLLRQVQDYNWRVAWEVTRQPADEVTASGLKPRGIPAWDYSGPPGDRLSVWQIRINPARTPDYIRAHGKELYD